MKKYYPVLLLLACVGCAPSRFVKPLEKGQKAIGFNIGGALFEYGKSTIPMPLTSVSAGYGVKENLTAFAALHTTSLAFGVFQLEGGIVKEVLSQKGLRPGVSITPVINLAADRYDWHVKVWPQFDLNAYWAYGKHKNFIYAGVSNWFELESKRAFDEKQQHYWLINPEIGHTFVRGKWNYNLEFKYLAPNVSNGSNVITYRSPGNTGAAAIYISVIRKF